MILKELRQRDKSKKSKDRIKKAKNIVNEDFLLKRKMTQL